MPRVVTTHSIKPATSTAGSISSPDVPIVKSSPIRKRIEATSTPSSTPFKSSEITLQTLNSFLICPLCNGYLINAHTLTECSHAFCKSCLWSYSRNAMINDQPLTCPICGTTQQLFHTKPEHGVRPDHLLQNLVYKLVPGLVGAEVARRRKFFMESQQRASVDGAENTDNAANKPVNLSIEYAERTALATRAESPLGSHAESSANGDNVGARNSSPSGRQRSRFPRIFLLCPSELTVRHLKKFIMIRHSLSPCCDITVLSESDEAMHDSLSLGDVGFLINFNSGALVRLFFLVTEFKLPEKRKTRNSSGDRLPQRTATPLSDNRRRRRRRATKSPTAVTPVANKETEPTANTTITGDDDDDDSNSMSSVEDARLEHDPAPVVSSPSLEPPAKQSSSQPSTSTTTTISSYLSVADPERPKLLLRRVSSSLQEQPPPPQVLPSSGTTPGEPERTLETPAESST